MARVPARSQAHTTGGSFSSASNMKKGTTREQAARCPLKVAEKDALRGRTLRWTCRSVTVPSPLNIWCVSDNSNSHTLTHTLSLTHTLYTHTTHTHTHTHTHTLNIAEQVVVGEMGVLIAGIGQQLEFRRLDDLAPASSVCPGPVPHCISSLCISSLYLLTVSPQIRVFCILLL